MGHGKEPCPDCLHVTCPEECNCDCDAARAEDEASRLKVKVEKLEKELADERWVFSRVEADLTRAGIEIFWTDGGGGAAPSGWHRNPYINIGSRQSLESRLAFLERENAELRADYVAESSTRSLLESQLKDCRDVAAAFRASFEKQVAETERQLADTRASMAATEREKLEANRRITELEQSLDEWKNGYAKRMRSVRELFERLGNFPDESWGETVERVLKYLGELRQLKQLKPPVTVPAKPVCEVCNDTHWIETIRGKWMCTRCPKPCEKCREGAFCKTTPCDCDCHKRPLTS